MRRLFFLYTFLTAVVITIFVVRFSYPLVVIPGHILLVLPVHAFFFGIFSLLSKRWTKRSFFVIYFGIYFTIWSFFYGMIFLSNMEWGDTIYLNLFLRYLKNIPELLSALGYSGSFIVGCLVVFLMAVVGFHYFLFRFCKRRLVLYDRLKAWMIANARLSLISAGLFIVFFLLAGRFLLGIKQYFHLQGEPVLKFCYGYMKSNEKASFYSLGNARQKKLEDEARKEFKLDPGSGNNINVVLIVVDALRADNLFSYGYPIRTMPFADSLLDNGKAVAVKNAYSTTNSTIGSLASLFYSRSFNKVGPNLFGLPEALKQKGYTINVITSGDHTGWFAITESYKKYASFLYDANDCEKYKIEDDRILLEGLKKMPVWDSNGKNFLYLHVVSVHNIGVLQDRYRIHKPDRYNPVLDGHSFRDRALLNDYNNRLLQADAVLRGIFSYFQNSGLLSNTVFVITSDHGQSLGEGGRTGHVSYLHREAIRVPLIFIDPRPEFYQNQQLARMVDIAPTILQRLGLNSPSTWEGRSLGDTLRPSISYHENGGGDLNYHGIIENDSLGHIYRYLFNNELSEEELVEVIHNTETDIKNTDKKRLEKYRSLAKGKFDNYFTRSQKN